MDPTLATLYAAGIGVAGVVAGVLLGLLAEPIKARVENRHKLALLRRALYGEIGYNFVALVAINETSVEAMGALQSLIHFESYTYGKENPLLFYQLKESQVINMAYAMLIPMTNSPVTQDDLIKVYIGYIRGSFEKDGGMDKKLMMAIYGKNFAKYIKQQEPGSSNPPSQP